MDKTKLKELVRQLNDELERTSTVDADTADLLRDLEDDVQRLADGGGKFSDHESAAHSAMGQARALKARFAVEHPTAERFLREIMDLLAKVGI